MAQLYKKLFICIENEDRTYSILPNPEIPQEDWEASLGLEKYHLVNMHGSSIATTRYTWASARNVRNNLNRFFGGKVKKGTQA